MPGCQDPSIYSGLGTDSTSQQSLLMWEADLPFWRDDSLISREATQEFPDNDVRVGIFCVAGHYRRDLHREPDGRPRVYVRRDVL